MLVPRWDIAWNTAGHQISRGRSPEDCLNIYKDLISIAASSFLNLVGTLRGVRLDVPAECKKHISSTLLRPKRGGAKTFSCLTSSGPCVESTRPTSNEEETLFRPCRGETSSGQNVRPKRPGAVLAWDRNDGAKTSGAELFAYGFQLPLHSTSP